ncbi:MAG: triose-phosphate isomerase [bacterium]|nr:triose-phosphate isomerase [bacterium]
MKKYIIANWKCNKTIAESLEWVDYVGINMTHDYVHEVIVCPPFVALPDVSGLIKQKGYNIMLGAQSVSHFQDGSHTGEVSARMLSGICKYALIGHSERRTNFGETNENVKAKVINCIQNQIKPIVLVRDMSDVIPDSVKMFAFEPVGAIGTGKATDTISAGEAILGFGNGYIGIYGGSVSLENIRSFIDNASIHGVLIGSASLDPVNFVEILNALHQFG